MKKTAIAMLLSLMAIGWISCSQSILGASANERLEKRIPMPKGGTFKLENVNGPITVSLGAEGEVYLVAEMEARALDEAKAKEYLSKMEVAVTEGPGEVRVETRYPKAPKGFFTGGSSGNVSYTVAVPPGTRLELATVNGALNVQTPGSDVACETTNGTVTVEAAGTLSATTVNGKIRFKADGVGEVTTTNGSIEGQVLSVRPPKGRVETVNGSVSLTFPAGASFTLEAENVNGSVKSLVDGLTASKHSIRGDAGGGGQVIALETVNGSIEVLSSK
jgi:hypothetical protein